MTKITQEAIEAAWAAYQKFGWSTQEGMERAIEAALPFLCPIAGEGKEEGWTLRHDNYKRWCIFGPDDRWYMQPVGMITAEEAKLVCERAMSSVPSSPGKDGGQEVEAVNVEGSPLLEWAVDQWKSQVKHRPLVNVHRRSLDDVWRQVIRWAGGDPDKLVGPPHDELLAMESKR